METYLSNLAYTMPQTKEQAKELAPKLIEELTRHPQNIVEFFAMLKHFTFLMDLVKKDSKILDTFITALENEEISGEAQGCVVKTFSRTSYDFTDNEKWNEIKAKEDAIKKEKSELEKLLKAKLNSPGAGMIVDENGEVEGLAKVKETTTYFKTDYEKDNK